MPWPFLCPGPSYALALLAPYPGAATVLVDEFDARRRLCRLLPNSSFGAAFVAAPPFSSMKSIKRLRPVALPCGLAIKLPLSTYELPQSEIAGHWMKIAIVVEQRRAVFNAPGPDQEVDCLADCDPAPT